MADTRWGLPQLRAWQQEALREWSAAGHRGIVEAATGTGKTVLALAAMDSLVSTRLRTVIVVPQVGLLEQWMSVLRFELGVPASRIGTIGGRAPRFQLREDILLCVLNSARRSLPPIVKHWRESGNETLLIVDECHRSGSESNAKIFTEPFDFTLGLSATPERDDDGLEKFVFPGIGPVVARYPLRRALDDGVLSAVRSYNVYFRLPAAELYEYRKVDGQIARMREAIEKRHVVLREGPEALQIARAQNPAIKKDLRRLENLQRKRRKVVARSQMRANIMKACVGQGWFARRRTILFHESIEMAESSLGALREADIRAVIDHSKLSPELRKSAFRKFGNGQVDALVVVRTADEGIDVPEADMAILVSGTLTPRQRIQRFGRVLRPSAKEAVCISFLGRDTAEESVGHQDVQLLGESRVESIVWEDETSLGSIIVE